MIKTVSVINQLSQSVTFDLRNPEQSGFFIRSIDGLGPGKAIINMDEPLSIDGGVFNSAKRGKRNIIFNLGFIENNSIEDSRQNSYMYFPLKKPIDIIIETDNKTIRTNGYVESNEPDIFSKESATIISVICEDPNLYSMNKGNIKFNSNQAVFTFPFSNESLVEDLIVFGNVSNEPIYNIPYYGDVPIGISIYITLLGSVSSFTIYNVNTRETMTIDSMIIELMTGSGLMAEDKIIISTVIGKKSIYLQRNGVLINIFNALADGYSWFELHKGDNQFYYKALVGESNLNFEIEYDIAYEGI